MFSPEILEWLAVFLALIYVVLASKGWRSCFVFGLISSAIFVEICFRERLYFDAGISAYYVIMSIVGWYGWKNESGEIEVVKIGRSRFIYLISIALVVSITLGFVTLKYTDASLPYADSFTTVMAVLATWLMVKRIIQNWLIWIVADAVSIFMYLYKGHQPIAILFLVYTLVAIYGYLNWNKKVIES
jgi:nicotinamide mononucleotide transporter